MNWGRKKKTSASPAPGKGMGSITKMFPLSWISRLRQKDGNENGRRLRTRMSGSKVKDVKRNAGLQEEKSCRAEKFYGEAEENFWRLSFSDEGVQGRKSVGGCPGSLSCDWLDETEFSPSTCRSCGGKGASKVVKKESIDFNDMLLDMRKARDSKSHVEAKRETNGKIAREPTKSKAPRRDGKLKNLDLHQLSHGLNRDVMHASLESTDDKMVGERGAKGDSNIQNLAVKDITEVEAVKPKQAFIRVNCRSPSSLSSENHHHEATKNSKLQGSDCKNIGEVNLAELSLGTGEERKSIYISKDSPKRRSKSGRSSKVKVYSPRTPSKAELCKIRALEDLKKTRMKMRVKKKEVQEKAALESLAVVKRSFDPQRDFRNSMLEMILDKGISQPEELEELLTCYLILNSDEYHDLIIKVFRQVWFDLNKDRLDPPLRD